LNGMFKDKGGPEDSLLRRVPTKLNQRSWGALRVQFARVTPVDSDHTLEKEHPALSHLIQYVDVLLGANSQVLDDTAHQAGKDAVAAEMAEWTRRAVENPYNAESRYYKRYCMSFFPRALVTSWDGLEHPAVSRFYYERRLRFCERGQKQLF